MGYNMQNVGMSAFN